MNEWNSYVGSRNLMKFNLILHRSENVQFLAWRFLKKIINPRVVVISYGRLSFSLTSYIQGLALLAFTDFVRNLALYGRVVQLAGSIVNNHLRGVVPDHLFLVDKPPGRQKRNKRYLKGRI